MALGNNNTQNDKGLYEPNYYSRLQFKNPEQNLTIGFTYWKGSLKVVITERKNGQRPEEIAYIHLSPMKAYLLAGFVEKVIESGDDNVYGVNTGVGETQGLITIGRENGAPYIIIASIDKDGNYTSSQRFDFIQNYHYGLTISNLQNMEFSKEYDDNAELNQFRHVLVDFARSANGALGASVWGVARYETAKQNNLLYRIGDKMGVIDKANGNSGGGNAGSSYFANNGNSQGASNSGGGFNGMNKPSYSAGSIDDLENSFE